MKRKIFMALMISTMMCMSACGNSAEVTTTADNTVAEDEVKVRVIEPVDSKKADLSANVRLVEEDGQQYLIYKTASYVAKERYERMEKAVQTVKDVVTNANK
jgi:hypothetical protein